MFADSRRLAEEWSYRYLSTALYSHLEV